MAKLTNNVTPHALDPSPDVCQSCGAVLHLSRGFHNKGCRLAPAGFTKGQRVIMTDHAIDNGVSTEKKTGTVVHKPQRSSVAVRIDGRGASEYYDASFWEPLSDPLPHN